MATPVMATRSEPAARKKWDTAAWLSFAASPTFALMALAEAQRMTMSTAMPGVLPIDGMVLMYLLMSLFHLPTWLKLVSRGRCQHNDPIAQTEGD